MNMSKKHSKHKAAKKISRKEAISNNLTFYFTGNPCTRGHLSVRNVNSRGCVECLRLWASSNINSYRASSSKWKKNNAGKTRAIIAKRRADKLKRTPPWLTGEQLTAMKKLYKQAAWLTEITGIKWHVDHIVPLKGKNVSGLHIPDNLQVIPAQENLKKGNKLASLKRADRIKN
jgi:hypothetical protein